VDPGAEWREDRQSPVAELVAEPLEHDRPVGRQGPRDLALLVEVREEVGRRQLVEVVLLAQSLQRRLTPSRAGTDLLVQLARERAQRPSELHRPPGSVALPERDLAGLTGRRRDEDAVVRDLLDPPRRCAKQDDLAGAGLVDHLLVELADPTAAAAPRTRLRARDLALAVLLQVHAEQAPVRDRAARDDRHRPRVATALHRAGDAVPDDARLQLRELVGRILPGEHPEHGLEGLPAQLREVLSPAGEPVQVVDRPRAIGSGRDDLLREHVERVARDDRLLDRAGPHQLRDDGRLEQVAAVLREDHAARRLADLVAGTTDPLQPSGDGAGRLHLDDEVDGTHVDAQLERTRGHDGGHAAGLEPLLDLEPLLACDRAVMGADQLLPGELVEPLREPLGKAAAVGEDDRAAVGTDQLEDPRVNRGPDAAALLRPRRRASALLLERQRLPESRHVLDGHDHLELQRLAHAGVHDRDRARSADAIQRRVVRHGPPAEVARDDLQGSLRR
jgi:hypothetical protein